MLFSKKNLSILKPSKMHKDWCYITVQIRICWLCNVLLSKFSLRKL